jgi:transcription elongation factor Elf1
MNKLTCPECGSENVMTYSQYAFDANTLELLYEIVKPHHPYAKAWCIDCTYQCQRRDLVGFENE